MSIDNYKSIEANNPTIKTTHPKLYNQFMMYMISPSVFVLEDVRDILGLAVGSSVPDCDVTHEVLFKLKQKQVQRIHMRNTKYTKHVPSSIVKQQKKKVDNTIIRTDRPTPPPGWEKGNTNGTT